MQKLIKTILREQNYQSLADNPTAIKFFKNSSYWKYLKEDLTRFDKNSFEFKDNVRYYAEQFCRETRFLNLF